MLRTTSVRHALENDKSMIKRCFLIYISNLTKRRAFKLRIQLLANERSDCFRYQFENPSKILQEMNLNRATPITQADIPKYLSTVKVPEGQCIAFNDNSKC